MIGDIEVEIPDLVEPIEAWRCWTLDGDMSAPRLRSPNHATWWPLRVAHPDQVVKDRNFVTASCSKRPNDPDHKCPCASGTNHDGKGCGIYAYKELGDLAWDFPLWGLTRRSVRPAGAFLVWGKCLLWGDVWEHEIGYRAQYARISEIVYVDGLGKLNQEHVHQIASFYQVPLRSMPLETIIYLESHFAERAAKESSKLNISISPLPAEFKILVDLLWDKMYRMGQSIKDAAEAFKEFADAIKQEEDDG